METLVTLEVGKMDRTDLHSTYHLLMLQHLV